MGDVFMKKVELPIKDIQYKVSFFISAVFSHSHIFVCGCGVRDDASLCPALALLYTPSFLPSLLSVALHHFYLISPNKRTNTASIVCSQR